MGDRLHPPTDANPRGYFEDAGINELNNRILLQYVPSGPLVYRSIEYLRDCPERRHAWLARISPDTEIFAGRSEISEIELWTRRAPFCYKDTRFCYLLHLWRTSARTAKMVCVFRNPVAAAGSILHNCQTDPPLADFAISVNQAFELWTLCYERIMPPPRGKRRVVLRRVRRHPGRTCIERPGKLHRSRDRPLFPGSSVQPKFGVAHRAPADVPPLRSA